MLEEIENKINELEKSIALYKKFAFTIIGIGTVSVLFFWYLLFTANGTEYDYLKDLGSISGGIVSSLFSLAGLILVYVAFLGQKQQLLNQQIEINQNKEELKLNRLELQNQHKEMQQQNETLKLQNFENTYFNLIANYQKNVSIFYVNEKSNFFKNFLTHYNSYLNGNEITEYKSIVTVKLRYPVLGDFSFVYQLSSVISIIINSDIQNKSFYINTLWGLLSQNEKKCIFIIINYYEELDIDVKNIFIKSKILDNYTSID